MSTFSQIELADWRQFSDVSLDLTRQVTVLTGQNGCGKTTILNVLARHFGWNVNFVSTPFLSKRRRAQFWSDVKKLQVVDEPDDRSHRVGRILYDGGAECSLLTNAQVTAEYKLQYENEVHITGLHIPSHRPPATYHKLTSIPTDPKTSQQHYQDFANLLFQAYGATRSHNPGSAQKQSLISLATFGYGNNAVLPNDEYRRIFEGFQQVLRVLLPTELGFEKIEIRMPEVVLITRTGDFALEAMSGGINALFSIAWQVYIYGFDKDECTVTFDEPENHLHPSMQRALLPALANAFPGYKFIIATHSPFIVSAFPESAVYGLVFDSDGKVRSERLGLRDLAGTPNTILREILDVPSNLPMWVEEKVMGLLREVESQPVTERAQRLFDLLNALGITDALDQLTFDRDDA